MAVVADRYLDLKQVRVIARLHLKTSTTRSCTWENRQDRSRYYCFREPLEGRLQ